MLESKPERTTSIALFLVFLIIYMTGSAFLPIEDAHINTLLAESLLSDGDLSFTKREIPSEFQWHLVTANGPIPLEIPRLNRAFEEMMEYNEIVPAAEDGKFRYIVTPTADPTRYANTFGIGAALTAFPVLALLSILSGGLVDHPCVFWMGGKLAASLCVSGSAVLLFRIARSSLSWRNSLWLTVAYALGTGAWSTSSQALWQHGPNSLFLMVGAYGLSHLQRKEGVLPGITIGMALAMATLCRPTSGIVVIFTGIYVALHHPRSLLPFVGAGLPFAALLFGFNAYHIGTPFAFGQTELTHLAEAKTGNPAIFQTPLLEGLDGLLVSPSRGLFVYSPFLLFSVWGALVILRGAAWQHYKPLVYSVAAIWLVEARHFDWWSGWSYGYRHIVDTAPYLVLFLVPVFTTIWSNWTLRTFFVIALFWSLLVQGVGVYAYDFPGWNGRETYHVDWGDGTKPEEIHDLTTIGFPDLPPTVRITIVKQNIDAPQYRDRLWSWSDSQIPYHVGRFSTGMIRRRQMADEICHSRSKELAQAYANLSRARVQGKDLDLAAEAAKIALEYDPNSAAAQGAMGVVAGARGDVAAALNYFERTQQVSPFAATTNLDLAKALLQQGDLQRAQLYLNNALRFDPDNEEATRLLQEAQQRSTVEGPHE